MVAACRCMAKKKPPEFDPQTHTNTTYIRQTNLIKNTNHMSGPVIERGAMRKTRPKTGGPDRRAFTASEWLLAPEEEDSRSVL